MVPTSGGGASSMTLNPPFMKWTGSPARMAPCHFDVVNESSTRTAAMCEPLFTATDDATETVLRSSDEASGQA